MVSVKTPYARSYEERSAKRFNLGNDLDQEVVDRQWPQHSQNNELQGDFKTKISQLILNGVKRDLGHSNRPENFTNTRRKLKDRRTVPQNAILVLVSFLMNECYINLVYRQKVSPLRVKSCEISRKVFGSKILFSNGDILNCSLAWDFYPRWILVNIMKTFSSTSFSGHLILNQKSE